MDFLSEAYKQALIAEKKGEVPIGAVIECNGKIIAKAHNLKHSKKNPLMHAEIIAIKKACKKLKDWRLSDCTIYVTLLPCPMCAGAIVASRIKKCVAGCQSNELGLIETIFEQNKQNHKVQLEVANNEECSNLIKNFFKSKR